MMFPPPPPPGHPPRVVVTGAGVITALGRGWKPNADGFRAGESGFRPVSQFDVSRQRTKVAAEVDLPAIPLPGRLDGRRLARLDRAAFLLLSAGQEALQQAGWEGRTDLPLVLGTTAAGMSLGEEFFHQAVSAPRQHRRQPTRAL